jgi:hypothetical protein
MKCSTILSSLGLLALAVTPAVAGTAPAPKNPAPAIQPVVNDDLGINLGLGYHTNYIWRGLNLGQHWVSGGINGAIPLVGQSTRLAYDVEYGFLAGDQDHIAPVTPAGDLSFQRLQLGAAIEQDLGPVTAVFGYRYFRNMGDFNTIAGMNDGNEVSFGLRTALGPVNLASSANFDITNDSWYFDFDASTSIPVTDSISVQPFVNVGYGKNLNWQFSNAFTAGLLGGGRNDITGWTAVSTGFRFPIKLNSRATLTPYVAGNLPLGATENIGGTARAAGFPDTPYKAVLVGGVTLSVRF